MRWPALLVEYGIRVNAIGPGTILTELAKNAAMGDEAAPRRVLSRTPTRCTGEPEEVAGIAVFLASDDASHCRRRLNFDPPCRLNFDPGMEAGIVDAGCA
jgi:NAD(P)-dependent dehydrogenase (short-subunit alcohol dehydrogenase family)